MKNKTSENMQKMYASKRELTLNKIQEAIDTIQAEGRTVTKKELIEMTELSSGTFSQAHVKELLEKNQVCQFKPLKKIEAPEPREITKSETIEKMSKQLQKNESKIQDLEIALEKKNNDLKKCKEDYKKLEESHKLLKGKYQILLEYLDIYNIDLKKLGII